MAVVNQVQKKVRMNLWDIVRFQLNVHCHLKNISVSDRDLNCLAYLAISGEKELADFCNAVADNNIFGNSQSVRNAISKGQRRGLVNVFKNGKAKKRIKLNPEIMIQTNGNILLDYKIVRVESQESEDPLQRSIN